MSKDDMNECSMSFNETFDEMFKTAKGCDNLIDKYIDCISKCDNIAKIISDSYGTYEVCYDEISKIENCVNSQR